MAAGGAGSDVFLAGAEAAPHTIVPQRLSRQSDLLPARAGAAGPVQTSYPLSNITITGDNARFLTQVFTILTGSEIEKKIRDVWYGGGFRERAPVQARAPVTLPPSQLKLARLPNFLVDEKIKLLPDVIVGQRHGGSLPLVQQHSLLPGGPG